MKRREYYKPRWRKRPTRDGQALAIWFYSRVVGPCQAVSTGMSLSHNGLVTKPQMQRLLQGANSCG